MIAVHVTGKVSDSDELQCLRNLNRLQEWRAKILDLGMSPLPIAGDYSDIMRTETVSRHDVREAHMVWLRRADCVFVTPEWENSQGANDDIEMASRCGLNIFYDLEELLEYKQLTES